MRKFFQIFIGKYEKETNNDPFSPSRVIQRLKTHPSALTAYLEHAVFKLELEVKRIDIDDRQGKNIVSSFSIFKDRRNSHDACQYLSRSNFNKIR